MSTSGAAPRRVGRYLLCGEIASGGMATVYFGRLLGPLGFSRTVALKRLHPAYVKDANFVAMLLDEARVASRVRHPNVVQVLDVVTEQELILVMEYVQGMALSKLMEAARRTGTPPSPAVASAIIADVLRGLHAAHEAHDEAGESLELIHRDISPQNILVHQDGMALVTDFGIARATGRLQKTREGELKGKPAYMAPEQLRGETITRRADGFATGIVLWEALTGQRLFGANSEIESVRKVLAGAIDPPSRVRPEIPQAADEVVLRALARDPAQRYPTAAEMQQALEQALPPAPASAVAAWVQSLAGETLRERAREIRRIESDPAGKLPEEPAEELAAEDLATEEPATAKPTAEDSAAEKPATKPRGASSVASEPVASQRISQPTASEQASELAMLEQASEPAEPPPISEPTDSQRTSEPASLTPVPLSTPASRRTVVWAGLVLAALLGGVACLWVWLASAPPTQALQPATIGLGRAMAGVTLPQLAGDAPSPTDTEPAAALPEPLASASAQSAPSAAPSAAAPVKPRTKTKKKTTK
jgi:serine/threonine-protein kinase